jgi:adenosylcobinamide-GDP ribazoletransferase
MTTPRSSPLRPLAVALSFLTRLPIHTGQVAPHELGQALVFFPVVGALLGASLAGAAWLALPHVPASLVGFATVVLAAALSGGLHLDGVADLFDGLGGGRGDRERTLAIMRDSQIGAHGAAALMLVLAGKLLASGELVARHQLVPLMAAPVLARFAAVLLVTRFGYARPEGLGRAMHDAARTRHLALAGTLTAITFVGLAQLGLSARAGAGCVAALVAVWLGAGVLARRLGGLTGDVYGAAIELCELCVLALGVGA